MRLEDSFASLCTFTVLLSDLCLKILLSLVELLQGLAAREKLDNRWCDSPLL